MWNKRDVCATFVGLPDFEHLQNDTSFQVAELESDVQKKHKETDSALVSCLFSGKPLLKDMEASEREVVTCNVSWQQGEEQALFFSFADLLSKVKYCHEGATYN